jgi:hypothetical protein
MTDQRNFCFQSIAGVDDDGSDPAFKKIGVVGCSVGTRQHEAVGKIDFLKPHRDSDKIVSLHRAEKRVADL